ncbi:MAG: L-histidine N(alpha)-methyltransferase [Nitrospinales bacterium]
MSLEIIKLRAEENSVQMHEEFSRTVLEGLSKKEKRLPSWLIFDDKGSDIFNEITQLKDYHPAYCEKEILNTYKDKISKILSSQHVQFIELGAGDGTKAMILIEQFLHDDLQFSYIPIDISSGAIENLVISLKKKYSDKNIPVIGLIADYFEGIEKFSGNKSKRNFVLFQGATFSNRDLPEAHTFLRQLSNSLNTGDYVMIGFDLLKHPKVHYRAYNDPQGVFEKFNLHLLDRINRTLGANFIIDNFVQEGIYNWRTRSVESYIYSTIEQSVYIKSLDREFSFYQGEGIQTEQSYKYTIPEIKNLAKDNDFIIEENLFDSSNYCVNSIWKVK